MHPQSTRWLLLKWQLRLANLDRNLKVLLIEAGESNLNNPWVFRPGIYPRNMKLDSKTASFYESRPSKWLSGRKAVVPCAHILGGGSSINFMMYTRASASDVSLSQVLLSLSSGCYYTAYAALT